MIKIEMPVVIENTTEDWNNGIIGIIKIFSVSKVEHDKEIIKIFLYSSFYLLIK